MFDVIIRRGGIKSIIFVGFDDRIVKIVTNFLSIIIKSVSKFTAPPVFHKLLLYFIPSPSQSWSDIL